MFAVSFTMIAKITVAVIYRVVMGTWPRFGTDPWYMIPLAIAFSTPFQAGEEIGWRGYALPHLTERFGLARASIVLGVIWGCWHLPQFFIREADTYQQSFWVFVMGVTALSVILAWLWLRTGGSLLLTMLLHAAWNNSKDIVPSGVTGGAETFGFHASLVSWITLAVLEQRKYAILFAATILAARKLNEIGSKPCPARECAIADAISNAELILRRIDERWPTETVSEPRR